MGADGRIRFPGSPWPKGHALKALDWTGRLDPERGLFFDLHLRSANYNAEVDFDDEDIDESWRAPAVWNNYHRCTLSSTFWGQDHGVHVADAQDPLDFRTLHKWVWHVDDDVSAESYEEHSFHLYLLGHDTALRHRLHFERRGSRFRLRWTGKIALTYVGRTELAHSFTVEARDLRFGGFAIPEGLDAKAARSALERFTCGSVKYVRRKGCFFPKS